MTANAALFTDVWSTWTAEYQSVTDYNEGNGTLRSDVGSNGGTVLNIANGNKFPEVMPGGTPGYQGNAFSGDGLYNSTSLPTLTFENSGNWEGVTSLQLSIVYNNRNNSGVEATLSYGSVVSTIAGVEGEGPGGGGAFGFGAREIVYTWNFAEAIDLSDFQIEYTVNDQRTGFQSLTLSAVAVPEPSTYALLAGAFGLAFVVVARRRRA